MVPIALRRYGWEFHAEAVRVVEVGRVGAVEQRLVDRPAGARNARIDCDGQE